MLNLKPNRFNILTLSDYQRLADPITVITAAASVLTSIFPNIFGGGRKKLTDADWIQLIPGSGYWTTALRNYLKAHIGWNNNLDNIQPFTRNFVDEQRSQIDPSNPPYPQYFPQTKYEATFKKFLNILEQEKTTGGQQPIGTIPGGIGSSFDLNAILPIALVGIVLVMAMKKKKR